MNSGSSSQMSPSLKWTILSTTICKHKFKVICKHFKYETKILEQLSHYFI